MAMHSITAKNFPHADFSRLCDISYEEQLDYKKQVLQKRENELKNYTVKEKEKTDKIINKIKE
ncbi:MAG: hypothetical protein ACLU2K_00795 [Clostridia bacterium]